MCFMSLLSKSPVPPILLILSNGFDTLRTARDISFPMITRLLHTRYRVNDLDKTASFYKGAPGRRKLSRHTSPRGSTLAFFSVPGSEEQIEICHYPKSGPVQV